MSDLVERIDDWGIQAEASLGLPDEVIDPSGKRHRVRGKHGGFLDELIGVAVATFATLFITVMAYAFGKHLWPKVKSLVFGIDKKEAAQKAGAAISGVLAEVIKSRPVHVGSDTNSVENGTVAQVEMSWRIPEETVMDAIAGALDVELRELKRAGIDRELGKTINFAINKRQDDLLDSVESKHSSAIKSAAVDAVDQALDFHDEWSDDPGIDDTVVYDDPSEFMSRIAWRRAIVLNGPKGMLLEVHWSSYVLVQD